MTPPIAVVGMACRYPDANNPEELWETVLARRRAFRRIPEQRLRLADYAPAGADDPDSIYPIEAALLENYSFDRARFRVPAAAYAAADLTHWLALEVATDALADARLLDGGLDRDRTGVIVGNTLTGEFSRSALLRVRWPYVRRQVAAALDRDGFAASRREAFLDDLEAAFKAPFPPPDEETLAGGLANTIAGRICNHHDLHGGGFTIDGACSSSLLAVADACARLESGDLDTVLVGGVDLSLDPFELVGFARNGALANGLMRVFDAHSNGFWPGEGCGFIVLQREEDAARAGLPVRALIRGWGISSDGEGGLTRPTIAGQLTALRRAYDKAGFGSASVTLFEAHGTGTPVGDPIEISAIATARRQDAAATPALVGSIKANIGHTKAAAGLAGLIKIVMALDRRVLPAATGCETVHPAIAAHRDVIAVAEVTMSWPADRPLRAGVSSMGFGGINVHIALEATPGLRPPALAAREQRLNAAPQDTELFLFAAPDREALTAQVAALAELAPTLSRAELADVSAALARRLPEESANRAKRSARAMAVAAAPDELADRLHALLTSMATAANSRCEPTGQFAFSDMASGPRIVFLFPGQAAPTVDGGLWRRRFPPIEQLYTAADLPHGDDPTATAIAQPAIATASLAGLVLLEQLGVEAASAVSHSMGELAALHWAGAWDGPSLLHVARERGRIMADHAVPGGGMGLIAAPAADVTSMLYHLGLAARSDQHDDPADSPVVVIACDNAPAETVVSGPANAVDIALACAAARGFATQRLAVSHAFHSPMVALTATKVGQVTTATPRRPLQRPVFSSVTGALLPADTSLPELLARQVAAPVRYREAFTAATPGADLLIEVGPGRGLTRLAVANGAVPCIPLEAGGAGVAGLLRAAGTAWVLGSAPRIAALLNDRFTRPFDLNRPRRFLANPCEMAPAFAVSRGAAPATVSMTAVKPPAPAQTSCSPQPDPSLMAASTPLEVVRAVVARRLELAVDSVAPHHGLLRDLHLNSIAVGQLVGEAARALGLAAPVAPANFANATVQEIAQALETCAALPDVDPEPFPPGVDGWIRAFANTLTPQPLPAEMPEPPQRWRVFAPEGHPLAVSFPLPSDPRGEAIAICVPANPDATALPTLLAGAKAAVALGDSGTVLVLQQGGGGGGLARCLAWEYPRLAVRLVDLPFADARVANWIGAEAAAAQPGYAEAHYDAAGMRCVPALRVLSSRSDSPAAHVLGPSDVILASGGAKGIGAECALALARHTRARVGLLGRSPASAPEVRASLDRLRAAGITAAYAIADMADCTAVATAVASLQARLGPVTAVLHAAGINQPMPLASLDAATLARTVAVKLDGARNLLAAVDISRLCAFVAFSSIIARIGLPGEAHYALANEWLEQFVARFAADHPDCRCLVPAWSVWSGVGMGEKLGAVEALARSGVAPLPPAEASGMFVSLMASTLQPDVVVAGRFGEPPTLRQPQTELPPGRFLDRIGVHYPNVELVADSRITVADDPYLSDHVLDSTRLFPAVLGLEAMVQAAAAVSGGMPSCLSDVTFRRPVPAGEDGTAIRVAALRSESGEVTLVLRAADTGMQVDHFRATAGFRPVDLPTKGSVRRWASVPEIDLATLYGTLMFHTGRFRRVVRYDLLSARACIAHIRPAHPGDRWFPTRPSDDLMLGDPGARDAALHALQAAIPHRRVLPVAVRRIALGVLGSDEAFTVHAHETARDGDRFVWDMELHRQDGTLVERWEGLALQAIAPLPPLAAWPPELAACVLERRAAEILPDDPLRVGLLSRDSGSDAIGRLLGEDASVQRRPDGRPEARDGVSAAHAGALTLAVAGTGTVGCDIETVVPRPDGVWRDLLGSSGFDLASLVMGEGEETFATAATRVWAAGEALKKAGAVALPTMERLANGWVLFAAGEFRVATWAAAICGEPHVMAIARRPQGDTPAKSCQASPRSAEPAQATQPAYSYRHVVGFQDTNLVGNVYFVNHLEWQGRCREMFLRDEAPSVLEALKSSLALVTTSCACDYLVELEAFDTVRVDMRLVALEANRIELAFTYWREKPGTEELVAVGRQGLACLHVARGSRVAAPIPAALAEALRPYWPVKEAVGIAGRR